MVSASVADSGEDSFDITRHFVVSNSQDAQSSRRKRRVALGVVVSPRVVNRAVNLNHKIRLRAEKVADKSVDHLLSSKAEPAELSSAQPEPEFGFLGRHLFSQTARQNHFLLVHSLAGNNVF